MTNYFELIGLPVSIAVDQEALKTAYYKLAKRYHPDGFHSTDPMEQMNQLMMSGEVNKGYQILKDPIRRLYHILELVEGASVDEKALAPSFLMEMMAIHEKIETARTEAERSSIKADLTTREQELQDRLTELWATIDWPEVNQQAIQALQSIYIEWKYLLRIHENLNTFASPNDLQ